MDLKYANATETGPSPENVAFYQENGYLIAPDLISDREIAEIRDEAVKLLRGQRGKIDGLLSLNDDEPDAEVLKRYIAIHFPHKISSVIRGYLSHPRIVDILQKLVSPNVKAMQSMLFVKPPGKAGQSWHQDEYYIPTRDRSLIGAWIAVDDATVDNGCLWIVPGSNTEGYIKPRIAIQNDEYADVDSIDVSMYPANKILPVEIKKGSVIFFNGYTLHSSLRNKTENDFRLALVNHYMSAESMLPWDQDGKLNPTEDLRDIVLVAGTDPYAYKGITDVNKPYLRPEVLNIKSHL